MDSVSGINEVDDLEDKIEALRDAAYNRDLSRAAALEEYRKENREQYERIVFLENALKEAEAGTALAKLRTTIKTQQRAIDERQAWMEKMKKLVSEASGLK